MLPKTSCGAQSSRLGAIRGIHLTGSSRRSNLHTLKQSDRVHKRIQKNAVITSEARTAKGKKLDHEQVTVRNAIGSGSFGEVFAAELGDQDVVLKRVKTTVLNAEAMMEMEHLINVYASSAAKKAVAPFMGYLEVPKVMGRLTPGLWLVWKYEGDKTLAYYLKRRDCLSALAEDLDCTEDQVIPTVMKQIFESLNDLHQAGIIHRDVKPANIVFAEQERRFKFIDLGAAVDLRTGTNYKPSETILDPSYCPPEEYILPTDTPALGQRNRAINMVMSPLLWKQHQPDCFDTWSCGVVFMQLSLPFLRTNTALKNWKGALARCGNDLEEWRARSNLTAKQTVLLDMNDGLGWDLANNLLRPREIETDSKGIVKFVNTAAGAPRYTAVAALKHPYMKLAAKKQGFAGIGSAITGLFSSVSSSGDEDDYSEGSASKSTSKTAASGTSSGSTSKSASKTTSSSSGTTSQEQKSKPRIWSRLWDRVMDLEARVMQEASETQTQAKVVEQLRTDVKKGKASQEELAKEESTLAAMQQGLKTSVKDLGQAFTVAKGFFGGSGSASKTREGSGSKTAASAAAAAAQATAAAVEKKAKEEEEKQEAKSSGNSLAGFATNAIYTGLKLTGKAVNAMSDLAVQAEQSFAKAQKEAEEQRAARAVLVGVLQTLNQPLTFKSTWAQVKITLPPPSPRADYSVLTERQVKQVVEAYVSVLQEAEDKRKKALVASFDLLLEDAEVGPSSKYAEFESKYSKDPRFINLSDDLERRDAFKNYVGRIVASQEAATLRELDEAKKAAAEAEKAAQKAQAEADFRKLLQEYEAVVVAGDWAQTKRKIWADKRFDAVSELRRRELFSEYKAILNEAGVTASKSTTTPAADVEHSTSSTGKQSTPQDPAQLEYLKAEQDRLKQEYDQIQTKLASMEKSLQIQNLVDSLMDDVVVEDKGEDVVYKFSDSESDGDESPPAAKKRGPKASSR